MTDQSTIPDASAGNSFEPLRSPRVRGAVEVRVKAERRRNWTPENRPRIVRETLEPGAVAKLIAERHGISAGLLYTWRKELLSTAMAGFAVVQMVPDAACPTTSEERIPALAATATFPEPSSIEVTFPSGARMVLRDEVSPALLREVVAGLAQR
ncbi:IS66-like element accessory protein TnpA [Roseomonas sp. USHLN139]|uniref:IS66-like element accessory protein TnpA n=1 Tax=Roseomonas sp. USHLN139 TaxID=3081298 RepID=UPI003B02A7E0